MMFEPHASSYKLKQAEKVCCFNGEFVFDQEVVEVPGNSHEL